MVTPWEENQILKDILEGLGAAMHEKDLDERDLTQVKLNKLLYFAINNFKLPITYSWFKFGVSLDANSQVDTRKVVIQPLDAFRNPTEPRIQRPGTRYYSPEEYYYYFRDDVSELESIFEDDSKEYLITFYENYAPPEYQTIYTQNALLQKAIDAVRNSEQPGTHASEIIDDADQAIKSLNYELMTNELFDDVVDYHLNYVDLLRDTLATSADLGDEMTDSQESLLVELIDFYYSHSWKFITLAISEDTAQGPNRRELVSGTLDEMSALEKTYEDELSVLRELCEIEDLLPYHNLRDSELETRLIEGYKERAEADKDLVNEWRHVS